MKRKDKFYSKKSARKDPKRFINRRILFFLIFLGILFISLVARLFYIQIALSESLTKKALDQLTRTETVYSDRGIIYDRNNKELAINVSRADVAYNKKSDNFKRREKESKEKFEERVEKKLTEDSQKIAKVLDIDQAKLKAELSDGGYIRIISNLDRSKAKKLRELSIPELVVEDVSRRYYPFNNLASHVIGFANDNNVGMYGVESSYDRELSGTPGKKISIKNNNFKKIPLTEEENFAPKEGESIMLSIDANIQQFAEYAAAKAMEENKADRVFIIVQDVNTGEILAMTNKLDYDLNHPKEPIDKEQKEKWNRMTGEEKIDTLYANWRNFCVSDQYEPGSVFKLITAASALEDATTDPKHIYNCPGQIEISGQVLKCSSKTRGNKTLEQALAESCNVSFIKIGQSLGRDELLRFIKAFGFGQRTGIDLNAEAIGQIPASAKNIGPVKLATMSYGHGLAVTPIQLINATSAIVNGGYLNKPSVVKATIDSKGNVVRRHTTECIRQVISNSTSKTMLSMMEKVVTEGTGKAAAVEGYRVGGKSGTANKPAKEGGYQDAYMSSFIAVAPINDPKISVLVIVDNPKGEVLGGVVAAPFAGEVVRKSLNYLKIPKTEAVEKEKDSVVDIPDVTNMLLEDAGKILINKGLKFNTENRNVSDIAVVTAQNPIGMTEIKEDTVVDLALNNNDSKTKVMPDLSFKSRSEVESILKKFKLKYNIIGEGVFKSQSPKKGAKLDADSEITVKYSTGE